MYRYIVKNNVPRKAKTFYDLEWREYVLWISK